MNSGLSIGVLGDFASACRESETSPNPSNQITGGGVDNRIEVSVFRDPLKGHVVSERYCNQNLGGGFLDPGTLCVWGNTLGIDHRFLLSMGNPGKGG